MGVYSGQGACSAKASAKWEAEVPAGDMFGLCTPGMVEWSTSDNSRQKLDSMVVPGLFIMKSRNRL